MPSVTAYHAGGGTDTVSATVGYALKEQLGNMWRLTIDLERSQAQSLNLVRKEDEIELSGVRRGVLADIETGGSAWTLKVYSPEWYATLTEPTDGGNRRQGDDNTLITNLINEVPEWSVGSIADLTGPMTFVFNHALRHEAIRKIEKNVPGELEFEDDGTVNYSDRRGTDRSGSITLSPSNQNVEKRIRVVERGRTLDATHVRVLGAHEGEAQFFANLVPSSDGASYDNRVDYSTSRWSSGDQRDWDRWQNKDVMSQDTIEEEAAALGEELKESYVEVETTVSGVDLNLGDTVQVKKADADIDRAMRVHKITTKTDDDTPAGTVQDVTLSTRNVARQDVGADRRDIQRFNTAFQGSAVVESASGGIQAVDSSLNYQLPVFYPAVEFEHEVKLYVKSLPYRVFSSGAASGGGTTQTSSSSSGAATTTSNNDTLGRTLLAQKDYSSDFTLSPGNSKTITATISEDSNTENVKFESNLSLIENGNKWIEVQIQTPSGVTNQQFTGRTAEFGTWHFTAIAEGALSKNDDVDFRLTRPQFTSTDIEINASGSTPITVQDEEHEHTFDPPDHQHSVTFPDHTHPVDPGVTEFANETASGVDVLVNGSTAVSDIGTGTFETTVDLANELTDGQFNTIELASDSLGVLIATIGIRAYEQIGG